MTSATPYALESSVTKSLSPRTHQPPSCSRSARLTTTRSGRDRKRATTTAPSRNRPPRRTSRASPSRSVGAMDGPRTRTANSGSCNLKASVSRGVTGQTYGVVSSTDHRKHVWRGPDATSAFPHASYRGQRPLRPALRGLRPGAGPDRGRVDQGHHREVPGQHRPGVPYPRHHHQGAAGRAREAPPLGALDGLLQGAALREVPEPEPAVQRGHQARRRVRRQGFDGPGGRRPTARQDRGDLEDLLGDQAVLRSAAVVRPARPSDVPAVVAMVHELAEFERAADQCHPTSDQLAGALCGPSPRVFGHVAVDDGDTPVGFALWFLNFSTWAGTHGLYLEDLYVRPVARGTGAGGALFAALAQICVQRGY